jgi:hypothetical protein
MKKADAGEINNWLVECMEANTLNTIIEVLLVILDYVVIVSEEHSAFGCAFILHTIACYLWLNLGYLPLSFAVML